jgi:hypothetical protein
MGKCNCTMSISVLGDGCQFCQPQTHIDLMQENYAELLSVRDDLLAALKGVMEVGGLEKRQTAIALLEELGSLGNE